jgi:hypothetical protein
MNSIALGFDCDHLHIYQKEKKNRQSFLYLIQIKELLDVTDVNNSFIFAT